MMTMGAWADEIVALGRVLLCLIWLTFLVVICVCVWVCVCD